MEGVKYILTLLIFASSNFAVPLLLLEYMQRVNELPFMRFIHHTSVNIIYFILNFEFIIFAHSSGIHEKIARQFEFYAQCVSFIQSWRVLLFSSVP